MQLGHNYIGTEHILLGLVREGEGVAAQVLMGRGVALDSVRSTVIGEVRRLGANPGRPVPRRTAGAEEAIANAQQLAGSGPTGSHHLLEALARSDDNLAGKVLASLGVDADTLAATIDELGTEGTSDDTPEETAARMMELRIEGGAAHVVLGDPATVDMVRTIIESFDGPVRGNDPSAGSLAGLWQAITAGLEELRNRVAPSADDPSAAQARSSLVRQAIQNRLARRRRDG
jgi:ATP-dependent Clp protease ATP-binding subunit ClpC